MKLYFAILFLAFTSLGASAQDNIKFIATEVKTVDVWLMKSGDHLKLNNAQKEKLHIIFENKFNRVEQIISRQLGKSKTSHELTKIEDEFRSDVESVLSIDQRMAYQKKKKAIAVTSE
ncbi:MAG: hypothetical protein H7X99_08860 [Saprospiraceae bacterium]|nr:hypothetical protein [Saprospiraceae bacterium]